MKLNDELTEISGKNQAWNPQVVADYLREEARAGKGWVIIEVLTKTAEEKLISWAEAEGIKRERVMFGICSHGVLLYWGFYPEIITGASATIMQDGTLVRKGDNG